MRLSFIQSNWYRQYPFRKYHGDVDLNGNHMPTDILVAAQLSLNDIENPVYINKLVTNNGVIGVEIGQASAVIGWAVAQVTESNQNIPVSNSTGVIGSITVGNFASCVDRQAFYFDISNGLLEPSVITLIAPPTVTGITVKNTKMTGAVAMASNTIAIGSGPTLTLKVPADSASRKDRQAQYLTCERKIIGGINSVLPDENGNINIVAIAPLQIEETAAPGVFKLTLSPITKAELCKTYNIAPVNPSSEPAGDIVTSLPEYKNWPQFNFV